MSKPVVYLALRVQPAKFDLSSFTANLGPVSPPMDFDRDLVCRVDPDFVARDIEVRVRLKSQGGPVRAVVLGWSSDFKDNDETPVDERWKIIDTTEIPSAGVIVLKGTFQPYKE